MGLVRQLDTYPTGSRRQRVLAAAVLASLVCSYEGAIAPIVPLLIGDLNMSLTTYGSISAVAAISGAIAALIGGRLTDTVGRVKLLIPLMSVCALLCFATALVQNPTEFLILRIVLSFVDGMALASTAPLVRDFSPRMGRATALAFWSCGAVGANLLAAAVAAATFSVFDDSWRALMVIQGVLSLIISVVVIANLAELSPALRARIQQTEELRVAEEPAAETAGDSGDAGKPAGMLGLLKHPVMWIHLIGVSFFLILYLTLSLYGQTMLVDSFGLSASEASLLMMGYWVVNMISLIVGGMVSDRLQLRRVFVLGSILVGGAATLWLTVIMSRGDSVSVSQLILPGFLVAFGLAFGYGGWMANFSENGEDIDPRSQGSAWGLYSSIIRAMGVFVLIGAPYVVQAGGWQRWMFALVLGICVFLGATFFFKGPWFHRPHVEVVPTDVDVPTPRGEDAATHLGASELSKARQAPRER